MQSEVIIENPFLKKGQGIDFFYDLDTKLTKRRMQKQEALKAKKLEDALKEKQLANALEQKPEVDFRDSNYSK